MKAINHHIAIIGLAIGIASSSALGAQTPIGFGHVDIGIAFENNEWDLHIHDETIDQEYEPGEATLVVRHPARSAIPSDTRFAFLGSAGAPLWVLSQIQNHDLLFLGIAAEEIEKGIFAGDQLRLTLKQVKGPGHFFVYSTSGAAGTPDVRMNSRDGVSDADFATVLAGGHTDYNWAFTAPGTYEVTFEASGVLTAENRAVSSGLIAYTFVVEPAPGSQGDIIGYYVGVDSLPRVPFGTYTGLPNPNQGRLLFLVGHVTPENILNSHYRAIGAYEYTGPTNAPIAVPTNANHRIPETFTLQAPLTLVPGSGLYEGKLVSAKTSEHYSDLRIRSVHTLRQQVTLTATNLFGFGSPQDVLFNSNLRGRTGRLDNVVVALELVSISDGLRVGSPYQMNVVSKPGDRVTLGEGNSFEFQPVIWAEASAKPGPYSVRFKLVDVSRAPGHTPAPESGIVTFDFQVAPPPALSIARTVTLTLPVVTEGHVLESAASARGPWIELNLPFQLISEGSGEAVRLTGKTLTVPLTSETQFFRLRQR
ncbi:MAG: hypothetical protein FJ398_24610 [Verrucomicrobia bacterium]|nr:hypothetical protein [Verrucomicrobiota bacterium]